MLRYSEFRYMKKSIFCAFAVLMLTLTAACRDGHPPNEVHAIDDVRDRNIGTLGGTPSARLADDLGTAVIFANGDELLSGLLAGSVDCALMEAVVAGELVSGNPSVRILAENLLEYELRFAVPRENAQLLDVFNSALAALTSNGTLRGLRDKYFSGRNYVYAPPNNIAWRPGIITLAIPPDTPPYSFKDANGEYTGLDVEVARAVCDYLGVEMAIIEIDASELITTVWYGRADFAAGWMPGDIEEQVRVTEAYADTAYVVIVRR